MGSEQSSGALQDAYVRYTKACQRQARFRTQTCCEKRGGVADIDRFDHRAMLR